MRTGCGAGALPDTGEGERAGASGTCGRGPWPREFPGCGGAGWRGRRPTAARARRQQPLRTDWSALFSAESTVRSQWYFVCTHIRAYMQR